jgi:isopenicillin-N epimerase
VPLDYLLDPGVAHLNHGSYGAVPIPVLEAYQGWQRELERNPVELLARRLEGLLDEVSAELAALVGASLETLALAQNATSALNAVIRSLRLEQGDEILTTRHEYGALDRTWDFVEATVVRVEPGELAGAIGPRTRAVFLSHITSPTALVLPVEEVCAAARAAGVLSIVDGAHTPGHLPLDLARLGADVYAGNCHKWLAAPKGTGFLCVRPEQQSWIAPLVVSWGWEEGASFSRRHTWQATRDPSAYLALPAAIAAWRAFDLAAQEALADRGVELLAGVGLRPVDGVPAPLMRALDVDVDDPGRLQARLFAEHGVEVVVREWEGRSLLRFSVGSYVSERDLERLRDGLAALAA